MKKILSILLICLCLVFTISGCSSTNDNDNGAKTHKAYTFSVDTGDKIRIELDTTGGYDITSDLPFEVSQNGSALSQGIFIKADQFESYVDVVNSDDNARLIKSDTKDSNQYIFWSYNDTEYNIAVLINDSNTGILLGNAVSEDSAKECFERLTISIAEE